MIDNSNDPINRRLEALEQRVNLLEKKTELAAQAGSLARHRLRRIWLRPPLWTLEQHAPRALEVNPNYAQEKVPDRAPSIAIAIPSYNHRRYLNFTIDSLLSQNYPRLSFLVQDACSTDGTVELLQQYGSQVLWRSEPDTGQAQAINRAFASIDGEIMAYLNSDDILMPGTLSYVARVFQERQDIDILYGHRIFIDRDGFEIGRAVLPKHHARTLFWADYVPQETLFWRRRVWDAIGPIDESFNYALDWDFLLRAQVAGFKFARVPRFLGCFRVHDEQKTARLYEVGRLEMQRLRLQHLGLEPTQAEIFRAITPYLMRQFCSHCFYRWGILRH